MHTNCKWLSLIWYLSRMCCSTSEAHFSNGALKINGDGPLRFVHSANPSYEKGPNSLPKVLSRANDALVTDPIFRDLIRDHIRLGLGPNHRMKAASVDLQQWWLIGNKGVHPRRRGGWYRSPLHRKPIPKRPYKAFHSFNNASATIFRSYNRFHTSSTTATTTSRRSLTSLRVRPLRRICTKHCLNGGWCTRAPEDFYVRTCFCLIGFHGEFCQFRNNNNNKKKKDGCDPRFGCGPHAICVKGVGPLRCHCAEGYVMSKNGCVVARTNCESNHCQNGGTCVFSSSSAGVTCLCKSGFTGYICEVVKNSPPIMAGNGRNWRLMLCLAVPIAVIILAQPIGLLFVRCNRARKRLYRQSNTSLKSSDDELPAQLTTADSYFSPVKWLRTCCRLPSTTSGGGGEGEQFLVLQSLLQDSLDESFDTERVLQNEQQSQKEDSHHEDVQDKNRLVLNV